MTIQIVYILVETNTIDHTEEFPIEKILEATEFFKEERAAVSRLLDHVLRVEWRLIP